MESNNCQASLLLDFDLIYSDMPSELLNDEGYKRLAAITSMLPAKLTNFWGLESRLYEQAPLTDVLFEIKGNTYGQKLLAGERASSLDELCLKYQVWHEIRAFTARWKNEKNDWGNRILNMWLEYDTAQLHTNADAVDLIGNPSVFLGFPSADLSVNELREILKQSGVLLKKADDMEDIASFIKSIPKPGQLFQLGSMLGRSSTDTRLCVNKLDAMVIPDWLSDIGWKGDKSALKTILTTLKPLVRAIAIDLNLTETGISDKIGIECYLDWDQEGTRLWGEFLEKLGEYTYIHPKKLSGLLRYAGKLSIPPENRMHSEGTLSPLLFKMIHHIKLGFTGGEITDAKAYLAIYRPGIKPNNNWLVE